MANVIIDYLSFTLDTVNRLDTLVDCMKVVPEVARETLGDEFYETFFERESGWNVARGNRPYRYGYQNSEIGLFIHFGGQSNFLMQFSGNGCKFLEQNGLTESVLSIMQDRITRLDIAVDIQTYVKPADFINAGYNNRIKSNTVVSTPSGETCYIGSRQSEKYCRVYRYNEPHPRAGLLRVEYETKRGQAKIVAKNIISSGIELTSDRITKYYKWRHSVMPEVSELATAIPSEITTRTDAKTLTWLLKQAAPAFKRLVQNGTIENPESLFAEHFLPEQKQETLFDMSLNDMSSE